MSDDIIEIIGKEPRPTSIILAGVHGDEKCGVVALEKVLPTLKIEKGRVFIGYGNPRALAKNQRFTEANLNRMFKKDNLLSESDLASYEYERVQFLKKYLNEADALLDIHASRTPTTKPFAICEENAKGVVEYMPVERIVSGFDELEPGGTDSYMNSIGKIGICVECGFLGDPQSEQTAEKSIFAFLKARGHIANDIIPNEKSYIRMYRLYTTKTNKFILSRSFDDFEEVRMGQVIGVDGGLKVEAEKNSFILFARNREKIGEEAFLLGENKNNPA